MTTVVGNIITISLLVFGAAFIVFGLLGKSGAIGIVKGSQTWGGALVNVGVGALVAGLAVILARDLVSPNSFVLAFVNEQIKALLTQPIGGGQ